MGRSKCWTPNPPAVIQQAPETSMSDDLGHEGAKNTKNHKGTPFVVPLLLCAFCVHVCSPSFLHGSLHGSFIAIWRLTLMPVPTTGCHADACQHLSLKATSQTYDSQSPTRFFSPVIARYPNERVKTIWATKTERAQRSTKELPLRFLCFFAPFAFTAVLQASFMDRT
ncbi:MAG: hypothetical protein JWP27_2925 [Flaviaesturariibacter sp.]|nr:hypothetical protein [Flaviaesturariibacter sp.]